MSRPSPEVSRPERVRSGGAPHAIADQGAAHKMRLIEKIRTLVLTDGVCAVLAGGGLRCRLTSDDNVERQPHVFSARSEGEEVGSDAPVVARGPRVRTRCVRHPPVGIWGVAEGEMGLEFEAESARCLGKLMEIKSPSSSQLRPMGTPPWALGLGLMFSIEADVLDCCKLYKCGRISGGQDSQE